MKKILLIPLFHLLIINLAFAERTKVAQVGMQFLKIGVGARAVGMGEACSVSLNDLSTIFWNPGGLALVDASSLALYQTNYMCDIKHYALAGVYDFKNYGTVGVSLIYMDYPTLTATRPPQSWELGQPVQILGEFQISEFAVGLAYSRRVTDKLTIGGQMKYVLQDLGGSDIILSNIFDPADPTNIVGYETTHVDNHVSVLGFDFGSVYFTGFKSLRFGMVVQHFSKDIKFKSVSDKQHEPFSLPLTFKLGLAMEITDLWSEQNATHKLTFSTDLLHPRDYTERVHIGLEYWFKDLLALRGGYKFNYDAESFSGGVGIHFQMGGMKAYLDYSISNFSEYFDYINRFNIGFEF